MNGHSPVAGRHPTGDDWAHTAATRWADFPADAVPRPVVLLDNPVRLDGVFTAAEFEMAWSQGSIRPDAGLSPGLASLLSARVGSPDGSALTIADATATTAAFRCDRGLRDLPAYRLSVTGLRGACLVLAPEVERWWPADEVEARRGAGGVATTDDDGATLHLLALGGPLTPADRIEFHEEEGFVVVRSVTAPPHPAAPARPVSRVVITGRLAAPLAGRALVDVGGRPLVVTG